MIDGSLKVKAGQKVKRGEVLGLVGNSGNSGEPHLHFQLMNAPDIVRSEGFPYIQDSSTYHSTVAEGTGLQFRITGLPKKLERAMPTENQCINFLK